MTEYLIRRLLQSILVLFLVSVAAFGLMHAAPGGPTQMMISRDFRLRPQRFKSITWVWTNQYLHSTSFGLKTC
ncbi:hypothetical protein VQ056_08860 [Paenibacillus sp. JTLBN-2024]